MDIERNVALEIIDEVLFKNSTENDGFTIDNDQKAEWAIKKIAEERAETQRYINVCHSMILEYEEKIRKAEEKSKNRSSFLKGQLQKYFDVVHHKTTNAQETYRLPSGTLKLKYQQPEFKRDDTMLLKWLKENKMNNFIKTEESPSWSELKKSVQISGEKVVTEDGQIVEGVEVVERPPVFEVEL